MLYNNYKGVCCLCYTLLVFTKITNADLFSLYNDKDTNQINSHNIKQHKSFPHDSFELAFPFFNELFPLSGLDAKPKDVFNKENYKQEKDVFLDFSDSPESSQPTEEKGKKKTGKDKFIMSFTELFIPFQNRKNQYDINNVKKNEIFEDIFNSFPFVDIDGDLFDKHDKLSARKRRFPKKKYEKNLNRLMNSTIFDNEELDATPKHSLLNVFESKFIKTPDRVRYFPKYNNSDEMCCDKHDDCHKGGHCTSKKCASNLVNYENTNMNDNTLLKRPFLLDKTFLFCAIPGLIGFGALIFGIEVLRRHNELVKQTPFLSQYNQLQTC